jgi:hypothetical protein
VADRQDSDREVLTSLPRTRPVRRSDKRAKAPRKASAPGSVAEAAVAPGPKKVAAATAAKRPRPTASKAPKPTADGSSTPRRKIPPAGYAAPTSQAPEDPVNASADLIATAIQAAGELTQIGYAVGRQTLRSMLDRLPRP